MTDTNSSQSLHRMSAAHHVLPEVLALQRANVLHVRERSGCEVSQITVGHVFGLPVLVVFGVAIERAQPLAVGVDALLGAPTNTTPATRANATDASKTRCLRGATCESLCVGRKVSYPAAIALTLRRATLA
eukprot:3493685-Rhodomonas_salina.1